jgi:hypothetical protein
MTDEAQSPVLPEPLPREQRFLGMSGSDYAKIVMGVILGSVPAALIVSWINSKAPYLRVAVAETFRYQGEKSQLGVVHFTVTNEGSKEADNVTASLPQSGFKFEDVSARPKALEPTITPKGDTVLVNVKTLNVGEEIEVWALANSDKVPDHVDVNVRGTGVIGDKAPKPTSWWIVALEVFGAIVACLFLVSLAFGRFMEWSMRHAGTPTKAELLALERLLLLPDGSKFLIPMAQRFHVQEKFTEKQLAEAMGASEDEVYAWFRRFEALDPDFDKVIRQHKDLRRSLNPRLYYRLRNSFATAFGQPPTPDLDEKIMERAMKEHPELSGDTAAKPPEDNLRSE